MTQLCKFKEPDCHEFKFREDFGISDIVQGSFFVINPKAFMWSESQQIRRKETVYIFQKVIDLRLITIATKISLLTKTIKKEVGEHEKESP